MRRVLMTVFVAIPLFQAQTAGAAACEALAALSLPDTTITMAQIVAPGEFAPPAARDGGPTGPGRAGRGLATYKGASLDEAANFVCR